MRFAAIDIGSNGMRLAIAERDGEGFRLLHSDRAAVRLGHHVFLEGHLDPDTVERALVALKGFAGKMEELEVDHVRAVATAAVREARDGPDFKRRVKQETGIKLHIVDGSEEARLVHRAVRDRLAMADAPWMVMDLGGGSLELTLADHDHIRWCESRPLGTVRLLEAYGAHDDATFRERLHEHLERFHLLRIPDPIAADRLAATGGNVEALAEMAGLEPDEGAVALPVKTLRTLIADLESTTPDERMARWGFRPDRADVILPAALVYLRVAELFGADTIHVPGVGVKEGILLDAMDTAYHPQRRTTGLESNVEDSAFALGRAFRFEEDHHAHVARLALSMFDDLRPLHGLGGKSRRILHAAALLHDVGKIIAHRKHHKHSAHIIANAELPGLSPKHKRMAALVARYHRKALPKDTHRYYRDLGPGDRAKVDRLAAVLRVADALDKRHVQSVDAVSCEVQGGSVVLHVRGAGPFALQHWAVEKKKDLFQRVFGLDVIIQAQVTQEVSA